MSKLNFEIWTAGRNPFTGESRFYFLTRCGRWHARQGNFGNMILKDRHNNDKVYVVQGKMPEVEAKVRELLDKEAKVKS